MIPYNAIGTDDAESIMPWTNIGLIAVNFLVFFYELAVGAAGGDNALASFIQNYGLVPCDFTGHCASPQPTMPSKVLCGPSCCRR
jgi:hypothetical protein